MLDPPVLVDQNMVSGSKTEQRDHFPRIHLHVDVSLLFPLIDPCKVIHIRMFLYA